MLLDNGIMTVYRQENVSQPGDMPQYAWSPVWQSYYGEKTVGVNRYYIAMAHDDQTDMLIEVQRNRNISTATDKVGIDRQYLGLPAVDGDNNIYFRITQVQHMDDEDGLPMTDLALERVDGLE